MSDPADKKTDANQALFEELHRRALEGNRDHYDDPVSGYMVFTELFHRRRGYCCKSGCRHCPYGFKKPAAG